MNVRRSSFFDIAMVLVSCCFSFGIARAYEPLKALDEITEVATILLEAHGYQAIFVGLLGSAAGYELTGED